MMKFQPLIGKQPLGIEGFDRLNDIQFPPSLVRGFGHFGDNLFAYREDLITRYTELRRQLMAYLADCPHEANQIVLNHLYKLNRILLQQITINSRETISFDLSAIIGDADSVISTNFRSKCKLLEATEPVIKEILVVLSTANLDQIQVLCELLFSITAKVESNVTQIVNSTLHHIPDSETEVVSPDFLIGESGNFRLLPNFEPTLTFPEIVHLVVQQYLSYYPNANPAEANRLITYFVTSGRKRMGISKGNRGQYTQATVRRMIEGVTFTDPTDKVKDFKYTAYAKLFPSFNNMVLFWEEMEDKVCDFFAEES